MRQVGSEEVESRTEQPEPKPETKETRNLSDIAYQEEPDLPAIKRRLDQGADPNDAAEFKNGLAPLYMAANRGHVEEVDALADADAELGWKNPINDRTVLHYAAMYGQAGAVRSLAARGGRAAVDARNNENLTPLHCVASGGHTTAMQALLEAGAGASLKTNDGKTALDYAVSGGKHEVAELLRAHAAAAPEPEPEPEVAHDQRAASTGVSPASFNREETKSLVRELTPLAQFQMKPVTDDDGVLRWMHAEHGFEFALKRTVETLAAQYFDKADWEPMISHVLMEASDIAGSQDWPGELGFGAFDTFAEEVLSSGAQADTVGLCISSMNGFIKTNCSTPTYCSSHAG